MPQLQEKEEYSQFESTLQSSWWALPRTTATADILHKAQVRPEQIVATSEVRLPKGINGEDLVLVDQSVPRSVLGVGVGEQGMRANTTPA